MIHSINHFTGILWGYMDVYHQSGGYPLIIKHGWEIPALVLGTWENHRTNWGIFQHAMVMIPGIHHGERQWNRAPNFHHGGIEESSPWRAGKWYPPWWNHAFWDFWFEILAVMGTEGPNLEHRGIEELRIEESGGSGPELNLQRKNSCFHKFACFFRNTLCYLGS